MLPYSARLRFFGRIVAFVAAPIAGWRKRARENLAYAVPELSKSEISRITDAVCDNVGRTLIEIYSGREFLDRVEASPMTGPGVAAFEAARAAGRPVVLATAHLGNYDAVRGAFSRRGIAMGALYKPMANRLFNDHYVKAISEIGQPVFPVGSRGVAGLVRHLKDGGVIGIVADVATPRGPLLSFFGQPAHTAISAAEWALKYDALLIPIFGIREPDGLTFRIHVAEPIPEDTPEAMMQRYNDVVEATVRAHPEQWFWIHRRWKAPRTSLG